MQLNISILKSATKRVPPVKRKAIPAIPVALIVEQSFQPVRQLPKQRIINGMTERLQQNRPVLKRVKKLLPAVSVAIQKQQLSLQRDISIPKSAIKRLPPARRPAIPAIPIALIAEQKYHPGSQLPRQRIINGMTERSQQNRPVLKRVKRHLPVVSAAAQKQQRLTQPDIVMGNT